MSESTSPFVVVPLNVQARIRQVRNHLAQVNANLVVLPGNSSEYQNLKSVAAALRTELADLKKLK